MLRKTEKKKTPRSIAQTLQASVSSLKVEVHDSAIRKRSSMACFLGLAGESSW